MSRTDITYQFGQWMLNGGILDLLDDDEYVVNGQVPIADMSSRRRLLGNGASIWFPDTTYLTFHNYRIGPSNQDNLVITDIDLEGAGVRLVANNMTVLEDVRIKDAPIAGLIMENLLERQQSEFNKLRSVRIVNPAMYGFYAQKSPGAWGSFKKLDVRDMLVSGAPHPYTFKGVDPYQSTLNMAAFAGSIVNPNSAVWCIQDSAWHGTIAKLDLEGEANIGVFMEHKAHHGDRVTPMNAQADIHQTYVHSVQHKMIFDGTQAQAPRVTTRNGANGNGNHLRPDVTYA